MSPAPPDAIIVGSGAGGAAAAWRLVQGGWRVLLLEKGEYLPTDGSTLDVQRVVHGREFMSREPWVDAQGHRLLPEEHFNVGGKTKWYGAALLRFAEHEFLADAQHGCPEWPLRLCDLEPYYTEAEQLLGVNFFETEPNLARILRRMVHPGGSWRSSPLALGLHRDILRTPAEARHFDGFASALGLKAEAQTAFLERLRGHPLFTLLTHAEVRALIGSSQSRRLIQGVRLSDGREYRAPVVLLAAGALHSPRLLQRYIDNAGLADEVGVSPHIGRYLKLHLLTALVGVQTSAVADTLRKTNFLTCVRYPHSSVQPLGFDAELISSLVPGWIPRRFARRLGTNAYGFFLQTEDGTCAENRVLDRGTLPPLMDYDGRRAAAAWREHRAFTRALQIVLARAGILGFTRRIGSAGTAHACGTLICGKTAADSVVDHEGCVHGLPGLYVVDGSVLPRSSRMNPALTIFAWALRVSDRLVRGCARTRAVAPESAGAV